MNMPKWILTNSKTMLPLLTAVGLASCQTSPPDVQSAVMCDKCKIVWVERPAQMGTSGKTSGYYPLQSGKTMVCTDCETVVAAFFKTGLLKHHCSHCGGTLNHCARH